MVNYFIYAKDYSGSTHGEAYYHKKGLQTLKQFQNDVYKMQSAPDPEQSRIIYLHWGHKCVEVDEKTAVDHYKGQCGDGKNTLPETIIEWIKRNIDAEHKIKLIYIITDGQIGNRSIYNCWVLNENVHYEHVVFHAINRNNVEIDLSVITSFIKGHCTIYRNNQLQDDVNISKEFDYDTINIDNFTTEKNNLTSFIKYKFINSYKTDAAALSEIDKLKKMRNRLIPNISSNTIPETKDKNNFLCEFKNTNWYKNLSNPSHNLTKDIEKSISALINYIVSDKKSYAFDALKFEVKYSDDVLEEDIVDVNFKTDQEIEFPDIILDNEKGIPVILCTKLNLLDKLIFSKSKWSASFSKFKSTMNCPLFLLNDADLNDSIGYFYTLTVYKQLLEKTTRTEPRTRRPFHGGLVLVDTDDFDRYHDYILSATYFDFKKIKYNIGLFYFVLWKACEKKQWMDKNVLEKFKEYMLRRISTTVCKIGMSSLPLDPQANTSLPTALWYCVELSSIIFKDDPQHYLHERLRMYYGIAHAMIEILTYFQYDLDLETIENRRDLIKHVMILKKIPTYVEKVFYMVGKVFKTVNGFLVSEIENEKNIQKLNYLKLNHKGMLRDDIITEEINLNSYVHFMYNTAVTVAGALIYKKTFRPFFMIDQNMSFYSILYKIGKKVVVRNVGGKTVLNYDALDNLEFNRILSLYHLYLRCVKHCKKFPTLDEYRAYVLEKKMFSVHGLVTIFSVSVNSEIEKVFRGFENLIKDVSVKEFVTVSDKYRNRVERIKAETENKFENDSEILEFISREERKCNLKKAQNWTSNEN